MTRPGEPDAPPGTGAAWLLVARNAAVAANVSRLDTAELPPTPTEAVIDGYILYQGVLNEGRGLEALIDAMPQVTARLVICGEGDLSVSLRERADDGAAVLVVTHDPAVARQADRELRMRDGRLEG